MNRLLFGLIAVCVLGTSSLSGQQKPEPKPDFRGNWVADGRTSALVGVRIADDPETKLKFLSPVPALPNRASGNP